jgi:hypothetical protein
MPHIGNVTVGLIRAITSDRPAKLQEPESLDSFARVSGAMIAPDGEVRLCLFQSSTSGMIAACAARHPASRAPFRRARSPIALVLQHGPQNRLRATLCAFFVAGCTVSLFALAGIGAFDIAELRLGLALLSGGAIGFMLAPPLARRVDQRRAHRCACDSTLSARFLCCCGEKWRLRRGFIKGRGFHHAGKPIIVRGSRYVRAWLYENLALTQQIACIARQARKGFGQTMCGTLRRSGPNTHP